MDLSQSRAALRQRGYVVLPDFLDHDEVALLRRECEQVYEAQLEDCLATAEDQDPCTATAALIARNGCVFESIPGCKETRRDAYLQRRSQAPCLQDVAAILFGAKMQALVKNLLGVSGYLFNDQFIVKPPRCSESAFRVHSDSEWCNTDATVYHPYISVWCPLVMFRLRMGHSWWRRQIICKQLG